MAGEILDWGFWSSFDRDMLSRHLCLGFYFLRQCEVCSHFDDREDVALESDCAILREIGIEVRWTDEQIESASEIWWVLAKGLCGRKLGYESECAIDPVKETETALSMQRLLVLETTLKPVACRCCSV